MYRKGCSYESGTACYRLGKAYEGALGTQQNFLRAKESYDLGCSYGQEKACLEGESVVFQSRHEQILKEAFRSDVCQVWSLDPDDPDRTRLLVDVNGSSFAVTAGPRKGQTIGPKQITSIYETGRIYTAKSVWASGKGRSALQFEHHEIWRASEDPIDAFPGDESFSPDRKGGVMILYSREEETVRRVKANPKCIFTGAYPMLSVEHCSPIQALIAAQLVSECKGD